MNVRAVIALLAFVIWAAITIVGGLLLAGGQAALGEGMTSGIGWAWLVAAAFILTVVLWQGWSDVGLSRAADTSGWRLAWLPMIYILVGLGVATVFGLPPVLVLMLVLVNALFVGFSEELMFRGAILQAFRHSMRIWPAVLLTSLAFGSVHSLNAFPRVI